MTWREYEDGLVDRIDSLWNAVQSGRYRTQPSRRAFIPKLDGRQRRRYGAMEGALARGLLYIGEGSNPHVAAGSIPDVA